MATTKPTRMRNLLSRTDWDKTLTDGGIYLLAVGGFYVVYQTLYVLALAVGIPKDQAIVLAALPDLAIILYSRKAVQEVKEGRSAWGIRTIVAVFSVASFAFQLRAAWPNPLSVGLHGIAPAVWVIGHEMMLRGRLRTAKAKRRAEQIAAGLRPAPLPTIRLSWWLLSPLSTFTVWRLTKLWQLDAITVIRHEAAKLKEIPRAWQGYLLDTPAPTPNAPTRHTICGASSLYTPEVPAQPKPQDSTRDKQDEQKRAAFDIALSRRSGLRNQISSDEMLDFLAALPPAPAEGRPFDTAMAYVRTVEEAADFRDIKVTGKFLAALLGVDESYVSRLRKKIREEDERATNLAQLPATMTS